MSKNCDVIVIFPIYVQFETIPILCLKSIHKKFIKN